LRYPNRAMRDIMTDGYFHRIFWDLAHFYGK
jgi:hypothetical protein